MGALPGLRQLGGLRLLLGGGGLCCLGRSGGGCGSLVSCGTSSTCGSSFETSSGGRGLSCGLVGDVSMAGPVAASSSAADDEESTATAAIASSSSSSCISTFYLFVESFY